VSVDLFRLDGAVAVVTGASGWLGTAMVEALAEAGATVIAVARRLDPLRAVVEPLVVRQLRVEALQADVTTDAWGKALRNLAEERGHIDVLVNNAHAGRLGSMRTSSSRDFDEAFRLAVISAWTAIEAARPGLTASADANGPASVINIASMYGLVAPDLSVYGSEEDRNPPYYGSAKAALLQLTRYAAAELGPQGIRVNAISPGPFPATHAQANEEFVESLAKRTMLNRIGRPDDLKTALLFLASSNSGFVTGANIVVDGGWTAR